MLVLTRHRKQSLIIGDNIMITLLKSQFNLAMLGICAPDTLAIHRLETLIKQQFPFPLAGHLHDTLKNKLPVINNSAKNTKVT